MIYEFEIEVGPDDIPVEVVADITPGEPPRLTGHPDDMHDGHPTDWHYEIYRNGVIVGWEWAAENVTSADRAAIDARIWKHIRGAGYYG